MWKFVFEIEKLFFKIEKKNKLEDIVFNPLVNVRV